MYASGKALCNIRPPEGNNRSKRDYLAYPNITGSGGRGILSGELKMIGYLLVPTVTIVIDNPITRVNFDLYSDSLFAA